MLSLAAVIGSLLYMYTANKEESYGRLIAHPNVAEHDLDPNTLTIATFNIHCIPGVKCSSKHLSNVQLYIQKVIAREKIHVIILTEIFTPLALSAVKAGFQKMGDWKVVFADSLTSAGDELPSGVVIAWDGSFVRRATWNDLGLQSNDDLPLRHIVYNNCCQLDCLARKGATRVSLARKQDGRVFHVIGTHLQAWEIPRLCTGVRNKQFSALNSFCEETKHRFPDHTIVLGGDFNTPPKSRSWGTCVAPKDPTCSTQEIIDYFYILRHKSDLPNALVTTVRPSPSDHVAVYMRIDII